LQGETTYRCIKKECSFTLRVSVFWQNEAKNLCKFNGATLYLPKRGKLSTSG